MRGASQSVFVSSSDPNRPLAAPPRAGRLEEPRLHASTPTRREERDANGRRENVRQESTRHEDPRRDQPQRRRFSTERAGDDRAAEIRAEQSLWSEYARTRATELRDRLVIHYMTGHVRRLAGRLKATLPEQVEVDDLINETYEPLVALVEKFDLDRDVRFETFSSARLVGAMKDYLRNIDPVSRQWRQQAKKMQAAVDRFTAMHGRRPTDVELRRSLQQPAKAYSRIAKLGQPPLMLSFNARPAGHEHDDSDIAGNVVDPREQAAIGPSEREDLRQWITRGFDRRDRLILILYYYEQLNMREIGMTIGCSESRVSQRLDSILKCIRSRVEFIKARRELCEP